MFVILAHAHECELVEQYGCSPCTSDARVQTGEHSVTLVHAHACDLVVWKVSATNAVLKHLTEGATHPPLFAARIMLLLLPNSIVLI